MEIKKEPYKFICDYAESILPKTGKKVFEIISLMPPSLILPDTPYKGKKIRSNINCLFLAPSGAGKTTVTQLFKNMTYSPLAVDSITSARLESEIKKYEDFSLIVGDLARISKDMDVMKVIEGLLGEEKRSSRMTMRSDSLGETNGIGLLCGIPTDISKYFTSGNLFRTFPVIIFHNQDEHSEIGDYINENIGKEDDDSKAKEEEIIEYYKELWKIQKEQSNEMSPIEGFILSDDYKKVIIKRWKFFTKKIQEDTNLNFFRELHEAYRILFAHSFLNVFNRKIENNKIVLTKEDLQVALNLTAKNISVKRKIIKCDVFAKSLKDLASLKKSLESDNIDEETKNIIKSLFTKKK